jgi:hypothetical protein
VSLDGKVKDDRTLWWADQRGSVYFLESRLYMTSAEGSDGPVKVKDMHTHRVQRLLDRARNTRGGAQDFELVAIVGDECDVVGALVVAHIGD